jgi:hypothetical protein
MADHWHFLSPSRLKNLWCTVNVANLRSSRVSSERGTVQPPAFLALGSALPSRSPQLVPMTGAEYRLASAFRSGEAPRLVQCHTLP